MAVKIEKSRIDTVDLREATPAERLKHIRKLTRLSRPYIKEKYRLSEATLKVWENGIAPLTEKGLQRCINIYRKEGVVLSKEWIMTGEGLPPNISVNVGHYFAGGLQYPRRDNDLVIKDLDKPLPYLKDDNACMLREASFFKESYSNAVILMITNDDMEPTYRIGDYVGGRFRYGQDIDSVLRRDCIVRLKDGRNILRRLFKSNTTGHYNLACMNSQPSTDEPIMFDVEIEAAAPVIWHRMPNNSNSHFVN